MLETFNTGPFCTNSYCLSNGNSECVIIDAGLDYASTAERILAKYKVLAILITHGHMDHIDGIRYFNCPIYIHSLDEECLYDAEKSLYSLFMGKTTPCKKGDLEVNLVNDGDTITISNFEFKVLHTPGHTPGGVCYSTKKMLFSGDTLFNGSCGRTDFIGSSPTDMRKSLKKIMANFSNDYKVYPGHDDETTIEFERYNNPYVK